MLKWTGIGVAIICLIVVVAAAVAPWFVGGAAEANFKAQVAYINAQNRNRGVGLSLHVDSYHRGFYGSDANISVLAAPGAMNEDMARLWQVLLGSSTQPTFHLHINHGPVPFDAFGYGHWNFFPVLYTAEFQGKSLPAMSVLGAAKARLYVVQYFTGDTHARLTVPPGRFSLGVAGAKWQGGHLVVDLNDARDHAHYHGRIKPIRFQLMNPKSGESYKGQFAGLKLSGAPRKAPHDFWVGPGQYAFAGLTLERNSTPIVKLGSGSASGKTSETGDGRWLASRAHGELDGGTIEGWKFSNLSARYAITKLKARGLRRMVNAMRKQAQKAQRQGAKKSGQAQIAKMLSLLARAVTPNTTGSLKMHLASPEGSAALAAHIAFAAPAASRSASPAALLQHANAEIEARFDRKLLDGISVKVSGATSPQSVDRALQGMSKAGYLERGAKGRYHAKIIYRGGRLTINGRAASALARGARSAPGPAGAPQTASTPATAGAL